ncbi:peptide deformylase [Azospirillum sp. TSH58]|uniref:peptide deformylase n=1 Tax=Azospirillum sp. TSH58 TaxID=664962 RepID=UPI000D601C12|nr:peptide deformylase [Azospirillum sp. TSH58]AWJ84406.1 peptide deformylase [Azospirillum sp. TSH58]PWC68436.1 peptide deformylase [Azospirillum sp. TSH58]
MAVLDILVAPHPVLKQKAKPVEKVDARIAKLMDDMVETMYAAKGIGLAAPQIGILERVIVVDVHDKDEKPNPIRLANPEIVWKSDDTSVCEEGCLSVPDQYAEVTRPASVRVRYLDETNETREIEADGMLATCIQHEIDHLNGVLFVDYLSMLKRNMILRKVQKMQRA